MPPSVVIVGAGPAGLTAGYLLAKAKIPVVVLEADPTHVGGIARTIDYKGFHFDIGGHRFFSKSQEVEDFWTEILPTDLLVRPRRSRIFYRDNFYSYPLKPFEALVKLGLWTSLLCVLSYVKAQLLPIRPALNFEDMVSNQFGRRLYTIFFKTYTEKVWGMSCRDISADWAVQRIGKLSLLSAVWQALRGSYPKDRRRVIKTLIDSFRYPRKGPGMMWSACAQKMEALGGRLVMGHRATAYQWNPQKSIWSVSAQDTQGRTVTFEGTHLISSAPLKEVFEGLSPAPAPEAMSAAQSLHYRDFLVVGLIVKDYHRFEDNWVYIHDPTVKVGRVQNFKVWSPEMVPDPVFTCYGMEYFCFEGDGLWNKTDDELIQLASAELHHIGLARLPDIQDGCVIRQKKAYPVYDRDYVKHVGRMRQEIASAFPTLHVIGRNGMHKYNNQDHAMMTAMVTVKNILAGKKLWDPWAVNQDAEYIEEGEAHTLSEASGLRQTPSDLRTLESQK